MTVLSKKSRITRSVVSYILIVFFIILFFIPIYWMISSSFKLPKDILAIPPKIIFKPTIDHYKDVLLGTSSSGKSVNFPKYLLNSVIVAFSTTFIALLISVPAAYSLARYKFKCKQAIGWYILATRMLPQFSILIPFYILFSKLRLNDTYIALILVYLSFVLSFSTWMMKGFFQEIPRELEEAAQVDGCTRIQAIFKIVFPLARSGMAATAIFLIILCWNEFLFALVLTGLNAKTAPVAISGFIAFREIIWGELTAAGTLITLPIIFFFLLVQRSFIRGMTMGAIK